MDRKFIEQKIHKALSKNGTKEGGYGEYLKISKKRGIKMLHATFSSFQEAFKSLEYESARKEKKMYQEARRRIGLIPKCYGVEIVKAQGSYRIGIVLQHLGETPLKIACLNYDECDTIKMKLYNLLRQRGIHHQDLGSSNIMFYKGRYWVIDFSPSNIEIKQPAK